MASASADDAAVTSRTSASSTAKQSQSQPRQGTRSNGTPAAATATATQNTPSSTIAALAATSLAVPGGGGGLLPTPSGAGGGGGTAPGDAAPKSTRPKPLQRLSGLPQALKINLRKGSNRVPTPTNADSEPLGLLCVRVIAGRNLASKDRNGKSDPFLNIRVGDHRVESDCVKASLNPVWGQHLEGNASVLRSSGGGSSSSSTSNGTTQPSLPSSSSSKLDFHPDGRVDKEAFCIAPVWQETLARTRVEIVAWDLDRFRRTEYMGEISIALDEWMVESQRGSSGRGARASPAYAAADNQPRWVPITSTREKVTVSGELLVKIGWIGTPAVPEGGKTRQGGSTTSKASPERELAPSAAPSAAATKNKSNSMADAKLATQQAANLIAANSCLHYAVQHPIGPDQEQRISAAIKEILLDDDANVNDDDTATVASQSKRRRALNKVKRMSMRSRKDSNPEDIVFFAPPSEGVGTMRIDERPRGSLSNELTDGRGGYVSDSSSSSSSSSEGDGDDNDDEEDDDEEEEEGEGLAATTDDTSSATSDLDAGEYTETDERDGDDYFNMALGMQTEPKGAAKAGTSAAESDNQLIPPTLSAPPSQPQTPGGTTSKKSKLPIPGFFRRTGSSKSINSSGLNPLTAPSNPLVEPQNQSLDVPISGSETAASDSTPPSGASTPGGGAYRRKKFTRRKVYLGVDDSDAVGATDISGAGGKVKGKGKGKGKEHKKKKRHRAKTGRRRKASEASPIEKSKGGFSLSTGASSDDTLGIVFIEVKGANNLPKWRNVTRTGWDMDPFCIISFGKKVFRTRVIRHDRNPVWDERLFFHVKRHEHAFQIMFTLFDWDKMSSNDFVGEIPLLLSELSDKAPKPDEKTGIFPATEDGKIVGDDLHDFTLPLSSKSAELEEEPKNVSTLTVRAKFTPYSALRQRFWRTYLKQYDTDDSETWSYIELYSLLDSLGSTLTRKTIESFFTRFGKTTDDALTVEEAIICLEDELTKPRSEKRHVDPSGSEESGSNSMKSGVSTPNQEVSKLPPLTLSENARGGGVEFTGQAMTGEPADGVEAKDTKASGVSTLSPEPPAISRFGLTKNTPSRQSSLALSSTSADGGSGTPAEVGEDTNELEKVINIKTCPLCHKKLSKKAEVDMVSHLAVCASQDWSSLSSLTVANFVSTSQANRKWFTKLVNKVSNGAYKLGADSANIIVQNRMTGQLQEEKMQVYVRVGIRLWYRAAGSTSRMEANRIKRLLKSMTVKQGLKFDSPESVAEIPRFIEFHRLDMSEVLDPIDSFEHFNSFFYRRLKPDARPLADPDDPTTLVSCADCRMTAFPTVSEATNIWIKGRTFSIKRLLGDEYAREASRFEGGSLCIFRLAPADYHRYHSCVDGTIGKISKIAGEYYTVNPIAIRSTLDVYAENTRAIVPMDSPTFGRVMNVCISAMMVGAIRFTKEEGDEIKRGEEYGYFAFGGSTIVCLFEPNTVTFDEDILANSRACIETLVRVGMRIGKRT